ncbi:response regulator [Paenibacillus frigoriresistens]|uniref:response regulator n=1 Tax=Paenibacillus alginolyticus TaxID=59839 RepID=UPI00156764A6|nr:response regulator [Paenibacillus frigoriresistens]NRF92350.1 response regulator [Paenibacillus frigoriresistens]
MIKIMIVDDETIEREALQKIMERGIEGIEVVGHAENGSRAIQLARELEPDLILMDIKMPGLSGLEAIDQIRKQQPMIKYVMVTAYDTFEYARQAIQLGVKDYLVKPSKAQSIVEIIQKVVTEIEQEKLLMEVRTAQSRNMQRLLPIVEADVVTQLLFDHIHEVHLDEMLKLIPREESQAYFVIVVSIIPLGKRDNEESDASMPSLQFEEIYRAFKEQFRAVANGWIGPMSAMQIPVVVFTQSQKSYRSQAVSMVQRLFQLSRISKIYQLFVGIGDVYHSLKDVRSSYHEALLASRNLDLPAKHCFYEAAPRQNEDQQVSAFVEKRIVEEARRGNWLRLEYEILQVIQRYELAGVALVTVQQKVYELLFVVSRLMLEMGVHVDPQDAFSQKSTYQQLKRQVIDCIQGMTKAYLEVKVQLEPDMMLQIKQYIQKNAHEDISLEMVSEQVRLSPHYVSRMFKEQVGTNYIDYLTECRIERAKNLLCDPEKSLKEITFEIGYSDPNYFSRVFKKMTDISPSEYRKELIMKKRSL